jgi:hypothetical protein
MLCLKPKIELNHLWFFDALLAAERSPSVLKLPTLRHTAAGRAPAAMSGKLFPAMTIAQRRATVFRFGQLAVGTKAGLRDAAPEKTGVRVRHRGIGLGPDKLTFPM